LLLDGQDDTPGNPSAGIVPGAQPANLALHRAKIDHGMLTQQLGTGIVGAFIRLRAYAFVNDLRLIDVARDTAARRLRLYPTPFSGR
jgi:hypothetical protein